MSRYDWSNLTTLQLGSYAEYFVKMELTMHGVDIYSSEVDERGIDFIARTTDGRYFDVQVKSVYKSKYIYFTKSSSALRENRLIAIVLFEAAKEPAFYLFRSTEWLNPRACLVSRDYVGKASPPEWGFQIAAKHSLFLEDHIFSKVAPAVFASARTEN